jgi:hypothetical protein
MGAGTAGGTRDAVGANLVFARNERDAIGAGDAGDNATGAGDDDHGGRRCHRRRR